MPDDMANQDQTPAAAQQRLPLAWNADGSGTETAGEAVPAVPASGQAPADNATLKILRKALTPPAGGETGAVAAAAGTASALPAGGANTDVRASAPAARPVAPPPRSSVAVKPAVTVNPATVSKPSPVASGDTPRRLDPPGAGKPVPAAAGRGEATAKAAAAGVKLGFAKALVEAREKRKLTLTQVAERTRVPKEFVEEIEAGVLARLPAPVYTKSHLRKLCKEYGLDPAPFLSEYGQVVDAKNPAGATTPFVLASEDREVGNKVVYEPRPQKEQQRNMKKMSPSMIAVIVVFVLLAALVLIALGVSHHRRSQGGTGASEAKGVAVPGVDLEKYISPQQLPLKELPVPSR